MGQAQGLSAACKQQVEAKSVALADLDTEVCESQCKRDRDQSDKQWLHQRVMKGAHGGRRVLPCR